MNYVASMLAHGKLYQTYVGISPNLLEGLLVELAGIRVEVIDAERLLNADDVATVEAASAVDIADPAQMRVNIRRADAFLELHDILAGDDLLLERRGEDGSGLQLQGAE